MLRTALLSLIPVVLSHCASLASPPPQAREAFSLSDPAVGGVEARVPVAPTAPLHISKERRLPRPPRVRRRQVVTVAGAAPARRPSLRLPLAELLVATTFGLQSESDLGWIFHRGVDLLATGCPEVRAAAAGVVLATGDPGSEDRTVVLAHGAGGRTRYGHLSAVAVRPGQPVAEGTVLGWLDPEGTLHFEYWSKVRPFGWQAHDPLPLLGL